jgi:AraC-like DNA-binding protein
LLEGVRSRIPKEIGMSDASAVNGSLAHWEGFVPELAGLLSDAQRAVREDPARASLHLSRALELLKPVGEEPESSTPAAIRRGGLQPWQILNIRMLVDRSLARRISVPEIAELVGLSDRQLSRAFKISFGISTHAYVVARRLAEARRLMIESELGLAEIALTCGLSDQAHLCHAFKKEMGMSPSAWRRANRHRRSDRRVKSAEIGK